MKKNIFLGIIVLLIIAILLGFELMSGDYDRTFQEMFNRNEKVQNNQE